MRNELRHHQILVTGASGFTGSWLTDHLASLGAQVIALSPDYDRETTAQLPKPQYPDRITRVTGSVLDYDLIVEIINNRHVDSIFHLAAISTIGIAGKRPKETFDINIKGTLNILDACRSSKTQVKKIIVASTDKVYGDSHSLPCTESFPLQGRHPYDASKACAELITQSYGLSYGVPVAVARLVNIYGGGDLNWSRLVPNTIRSLFERRQPVLNVPRNGQFQRDFLYVEDLIRGYMAIFQKLDFDSMHGQAFNLGTGTSWPIAEVVRSIGEIMDLPDVKPTITVLDVNHREILHQKVSIEKAQTLLGWTPAFSLDEGLQKTTEWYLKYLSPPVLFEPPAAGHSRPTRRV